MEIKKILRIESSVHLNTVLDNNRDVLELLDGDLLSRVEYFQSLASEYMYGCKCEENQSWERLNAEYESVKTSPELVSAICKVLECDRIDFIS